MRQLPTDLKILNAIYEEYYDEFAVFSKENPNRKTKIYVPIDIERIAGNLRVDPDIVFGRLYYHLNQRYGYKNDDGSRVHFFALRIGDNVHCVNFPYLASVLSQLRHENRKHQISTIFAVFALLTAIEALVVSVFK